MALCTRLESNADPNQATTDKGATPLYIAAKGGHSAVVNQLLETNADPNQARTDDGQTPLFTAAHEGHGVVVHQLLENNADPNQATTDKGATPLYVAAQEGRDGIAKQLLENNADPNQACTDYEHGSTPLMIAAQTGHLEVVEVLLNNGANADVATKDGSWTLLELAAHQGHTAIANLLKQATVAPAVVTHPSTACDMCGVFPLVGQRFTNVELDYNLCESDFATLRDADKAAYWVIAQPGASPVLYS